MTAIDLEAMVKNNKTVGLADIAKDIRYIPLETIPEAMLNPDVEDQKDKLEVKDANKAAVYQDLLNTLDENDNPIVMVLELKKH